MSLLLSRNVCLEVKAELAAYAQGILCDPRLSAIECFDAQDCREVSRNFAPALTLVETGKYRATIGAKVEAHRVPLVTRHGLPQNGEVAGFLWQSVSHRLPGLAAVF